MSDKIAVSVNKAAYILFENGLVAKRVERIINSLPQPSEGYVYLSDLLEAANIKPTLDGAPS